MTEEKLNALFARELNEWLERLNTKEIDSLEYEYIARWIQILKTDREYYIRHLLFDRDDKRLPEWWELWHYAREHGIDRPTFCLRSGVL